MGVRGAPKFALLAGLGADAPGWRPWGGLREPIGGVKEPVGGVKEPIGGVREPLGGVSEPIGGSSASMLAEGSAVIGTHAFASVAEVGIGGDPGDDICVSFV